MANETWTLTKTVTVKEPDEEHHLWRAEDESWEFSDFGEARDAFRRLARECATAEGNVFDGDGNIRNLQDHFDNLARNIEEQRRDPKPNYAVGGMILRGAPDIALMAGDFESARAIPSALRAWLLDMSAYDANPLSEFKWTDWGFGIVSTPDSVAMGALHECSRIELYDAQVYTNAFRMDDPRRDYEFSARTYFDVYDYDAGSLRIRLVPGPSDGRGRFPWPEDEEVAWPFPEGPAPCIAGEFDGNGSIMVDVDTHNGGGRYHESLASGRAAFVDDVIGLAKARGLSVDARVWSPESEADCGTSRIDCYCAGGPGTWYRFSISVSYDSRTPEQHRARMVGLGFEPEHIEDLMRRRLEEPPIRVAHERFESYAQALSEVARLIDEHVENVGKPKGADAKPRKRIMIDVVCNFGEGD